MAKYKFAKVGLYEEDWVNGGWFEDPFWEGIISYDTEKYPGGIEGDNFLGRVLRKDLYDPSKTMSVVGDYEFGTYMSRYPDEHSRLDFTEIKPTDPMYGRCTKLNRLFDSHHKEAAYKITASIYGDQPTYYDIDKNKLYPHYKELTEFRKEWRVYPSEIEAATNKPASIDSARDWVIMYHPDYLLGASIAQDCKGASFLCAAVPGDSYEKGTYETYEARYNYAKNEARKSGIKKIAPSKIVGKEQIMKNYQDILAKAEAKAKELDLYNEPADEDLIELE